MHFQRVNERQIHVNKTDATRHAHVRITEGLESSRAIAGNLPNEFGDQRQLLRVLPTLECHAFTVVLYGLKAVKRSPRPLLSTLVDTFLVI